MLSGILYVFGGYCEESKWIASIESLNVREDVIETQAVIWIQIDLPAEVGRTNSLMAPIGLTEILIMGGNNSRY